MIEEWKDIQGFIGRYQISNTGKLKSLLSANGEKRELIIAGSLDKNGYHRVNLYKDGKVAYKRTNVLVAEYFLIKPGDEYQVNHIDGNKLNNNVSNLEWVTLKENITHAVKNGLMNPRYGEDHPNSILSESDIIEIYKSNKSQRKISIEFGVSQSLICNIKKGKIWKHVTKNINI